MNDKRALENIANHALCTMTDEGIKNFTLSEGGYIVFTNNVEPNKEPNYYIKKGDLVRYIIVLSVESFLTAQQLEYYVNSNPTSYEDIAFFAEWQMNLGRFGEDMRDLLNGILCVSDMSWQDKLDKSVIAQYLVSSWRKFCEYQVAKEKKE